jgi:negative regulator of sigma-B (phosphoserine phosphatase)
MAGERSCGDLVFVRETQDHLTVAVIDGLGHGEKAAVAADQAKTSLQFRCQSAFSPRQLLKLVHEDLRLTRGVVMSLLVVSETTISFGGVGNVDCLTSIPSYSPFPREGVLGHRCRFVPDNNVDRQPATIMLCTDGIRRFSLKDYLDVPLEECPQKIVANHGRSNDDKAVVVVRLH